MSWGLAFVYLLLVADLQNLLSWWRGWTITASWLAPASERNDDFTIIVPVYGHPRYFAERDRLAPYRANVLVALDLGGPHAAELRAFADEFETEGWRVYRAETPNPNPPQLMLEAIEAGAVTTAYVLRMDADTYPLEDIGKFIHQMDVVGADICSVEVEVARPRGLVGRIQALEYRMAMLSRRFRPWLTSGACFVAHREALRTILRRHSFWFPGEDIETGAIGHALGMRVRHLALRVATEAPDTWRDLYRQRRLWWAGGFRHIVVNVDKNAWHKPGWTAYYLGLVTCGVAWKSGDLLGMSSGPSALRAAALLLVIYMVITVVANWEVRSLLMLAYPPYAFVQALAMPTIGALHFCALAVRQRKLGRYQIPTLQWSHRPRAHRGHAWAMGGRYEIPTIRRHGIVTPNAGDSPLARLAPHPVDGSGAEAEPWRPTAEATTASVAPAASAARRDRARRSSAAPRRTHCSVALRRFALVPEGTWR
ncbi:MAG: glycosyltransferase family 2 protein [Gaiellaceae bacterium]|nr:glycosyltransferase family 2 protein [Gaiellaceae bacterium]